MESLDLLVRLQVQGAEAIRQASAMQRSLQGVADSAQSSARAMQMVDRSASTMGNVLGRNRFVINNVANQMQDLIIVSQGGARSLGQVGIQIGQAASAFGPFGAIIGIVATGLGFLAGALITAGRGGEP